MLGSVGEKVKGAFSRPQGKDVLAAGLAAGSPPVRVRSAGKYAAAGAGVGAAAGAGAGYLMARDAIGKIPRESVTLDWKQPRMDRVEIGRIPADQYVRDSFWGFGSERIRHGEGAATDAVLRDRPVAGPDGSPLLDPVQRTFTDHGKPVVNWETRPINDPELKGYDERIVPDRHYHTSTHLHDDGDSHSHSEEHVHGYWLRYSPDVQNRVVGHYQAPVVKFDHGVDVTGFLLKGIVIGAGLGALGGGLIGAIRDRYQS